MGSDGLRSSLGFEKSSVRKKIISNTRYSMKSGTENQRSTLYEIYCKTGNVNGCNI